jgi:hypothetical protein
MYSVYLGAAIDLASSLNAFDEMSKILMASETFKTSLIFRPDTAWNNARNIDDKSIDYLMNVNNFALTQADLGIFYISPNVYSQGVAMEVELRLKNNQPTYIIAEKTGLYLKGLLSKVRAGRLYKDIEEFQKNFEDDWKTNDHKRIEKPSLLGDGSAIPAELGEVRYLFDLPKREFYRLIGQKIPSEIVTK